MKSKYLQSVRKTVCGDAICLIYSAFKICYLAASGLLFFMRYLQLFVWHITFMVFFSQVYLDSQN